MQIHYAARRGDRDTVMRQLARNIPVDARFKKIELDVRYDHHEDDGGTALIWAAGSSQADLPMLELLVEQGADVNACSYGLQETPLTSAASDGRIDKVQFLLARGADAKFLNAHKVSPLIKYPPASPELLRLLIDAGADPDQETTSGESILSIASHVSDWTTVRLMLELGASPKPLEWRPLMNSVILGDVEDIKRELIDVDLQDLHARDHWSRTPWLLAVCSGDIEKATLLRTAGASLDDRGRGEETCLQCALLSGNIEMLRFLLDVGFDVNLTDDRGRSALMHAAEEDSVSSVRLLLENGADVDAINHINDKAISYAKSVDVVRLLVDSGADINYRSGCGEWPLKEAAACGDHGLVHALLKMGAVPDLTSTGEIALHRAVQEDHLGIIETLIAAGCDVNVQNVDGCGLLWYARSIEAVKLLIDAGIDLNLVDQEDKKAYEYSDVVEIRSIITPE
jgi:ankyrin repeat protein